MSEKEVIDNMELIIKSINDCYEKIDLLIKEIGLINKQINSIEERNSKIVEWIENLSKGYDKLSEVTINNFKLIVLSSDINNDDKTEILNSLEKSQLKGE